MKKYLNLFIAFGCLSISFHSSNPDPVLINFAGQQWAFPSTVREAVEKHGLLYKPPGYYYKIYASGMEVILSYHYRPLDFSDENQPKETLFPRSLYAYSFRFKGSSKVYDSLYVNLENTYNKKFVLTKGIKDSEYAVVKEFEWNFLTIRPDLTVGIKSVGDDQLNKVVTVKFMYDLPLGKMGIQMGNY